MTKGLGDCRTPSIGSAVDPTDHPPSEKFPISGNQRRSSTLLKNQPVGFLPDSQLGPVSSCADPPALLFPGHPASRTSGKNLAKPCVKMMDQVGRIWNLKFVNLLFSISTWVHICPQRTVKRPEAGA